MEFLDLSDEIGADEWLIESDRILDRRLVKRTPRFNIYKADYFGESNVLVYEPVVAKRVAKKRASRQNEYLRDRLSRLELNLDRTFSHSSTTNSLASPPLSPCISISSSEQTIDSAYSSVSSTPQYHTRTEFQYPTYSSGGGVCDSAASDDDDQTSMTQLAQLARERNSSSSSINQRQLQLQTQKIATETRKPVVLNKDSFGRRKSDMIADDELEATAAETTTGSMQSFWLELNELRLVAHESFMLFMGASITQDQQLAAAQCPPTLVMEMNHPKAVSFYNLLHNFKWTSIGDRCSPIQLKRTQLSHRTKSNICQQVTNAMAYLHARDIVHGKLTSVNIYMDFNQRIKISLLDDDERAIASTNHCTCDENFRTEQHSVEFNLPSLTYLSPELIRTISLGGATKECVCDNQAPFMIDTDQLTKESDIFSFGTFLFELFEEKYPFAENDLGCTRPMGQLWNGNIKQSANQLIYQIGSGQIINKNLNPKQNLKSRASGYRSGRSLVESIIAQCWSEDLNLRPKFKQLALMFSD